MTCGCSEAVSPGLAQASFPCPSRDAVTTQLLFLLPVAARCEGRTVPGSDRAALGSLAQGARSDRAACSSRPPWTDATASAHHPDCTASNRQGKRARLCCAFPKPHKDCGSAGRHTDFYPCTTWCLLMDVNGLESRTLMTCALADSQPGMFNDTFFNILFFLDPEVPSIALGATATTKSLTLVPD